MFITKLLSQHVSGITTPHLRENKTVYYHIWCSALVVLAVVVWSWDASCARCVKVTVRQLVSQLHTVTASTSGAEHHMRK